MILLVLFLSLAPATLPIFMIEAIRIIATFRFTATEEFQNLPYYFIFCCCCAEANNTYENIWNIDLILLKIFFLHLLSLPWCCSLLISTSYHFNLGIWYLRASVCNKWNKTFKSGEMEFATINCQRNSFWMQMKEKRLTKLICSICGEGMLLLLLLLL